MNKLTNFVIIEETDKSLETILEGYKHSLFLPNNIINQILYYYFPNHTVIHSYDITHIIIKVNILDFLNTQVTNCKYNRPPDLLRCREIAHYTCTNKNKPLDTMFYLCYDNEEKSLLVLDGIHRYTALKILQEEINKPLDLLTGNESEFNIHLQNEWFNNKDVLLNIRFNQTEEQQVDVFRTINKAQPVPFMYTRNTTEEKRTIIEEIANEWSSKYPNHFSGSQNPNIGNTNRDKFIDLLDKIYIKKRINDAKLDEFRNMLQEVNNVISLNIPKKVPEKTRERCFRSGCYLFLHKNDVLEEMF
jgi:hypothetical protein